MSRLSPEKRARICALHDANHSLNDIATLEEVNRSTASRIIKRKQETGSYKSRPVSGNPGVIDADTGNYVFIK